MCQVFFKLYRPLHSRSHSPQLGCHKTRGTGFHECIDKIQDCGPPLRHLGILEDQRRDRINNNPLRVDQLRMSFNALDKAQDRKVLAADRSPTDLHFARHVTQWGGVDESKLLSLLKILKLPAEQVHLTIEVRLRLIQAYKRAILTVHFNPVHQELRSQDRLTSTRPADQQYDSSTRKATSQNLVKARNTGRSSINHRQCYCSHSRSNFEANTSNMV